MADPQHLLPPSRGHSGLGGHGGHWRRDLVELAALFTAVTVTDLAAKTIVGGPHGVGLLAASALVLVCTAGLHAWWSRRRVPAGTAPAAPPAVADTALWRLRTTVREQPGALAALCTSLAGLRVDVLALQTLPLGPGEPAAGPDGGAERPEGADHTVDELLVRAPAAVDAPELRRAVTAAGGRDVLVEEADAHELVDGTTRALELAARIAHDSAELPPALRRLLGRCTIRAEAAAPAPGGAPSERPGDRNAFTPRRLRLADPSGGVLVVERPHAPFTPGEYARARALVALDRRLGRRLPAQVWPASARDGGELILRRADGRDLPAVRELHARCSRQTLAERYHAPVADPGRYLGGLLSPHVGRTVVAQDRSGRTVAVGHLLWDGEETEVALLVEDAWQGRGVGGALLRRLVRIAAESGCADVYAVTSPANAAMIAAMRGLGLPLTREDRDGAVVLTVRPAGAWASAP
ncbi:GNAT family N-acetyltransferase [Streptomyces sp. DSM 42041]|uniref:GNAT family N-acetyltransferase n=1 Tax=Streptomyces hazeniae TaxID=3075538 RepID=A0ABU2NVL4_9ACTN|nr:GNAT family N-acetyltransferase [Streptomyces sp. DSM 42041]MDT0381027.1 GNAT family N-acetyltransferase [Streptomyces sp. DSM 42041]